MKISIVIPVYNEERCIEATLHELENYMNSYKRFKSWEIIVVNDGSLDETLNILNKLQASKTWLKVIDLVNNYGRGRALRTGFEQSSGDIIVCLDADLSYAPYHIERMVDKLFATDADIVLASAFGGEGTVQNVPFRRLWISRLGNKILSYTFGGDISVLTCIVRAYKKDFIDKLDLHSDDKDLHLEILYKAKILGAKIMEVPADLKWRDKRIKGLNKKIRRSTLKFRKTSNSHFFFAMLNKPGIVFFFPANVLLIISLIILALIIRVILSNLSLGLSLYFAIRESMLSGMLSYITFAICFVLSIQFFSLGFLTNQNKKNYEETYKTNNKILSELRKKGNA